MAHYHVSPILCETSEHLQHALLTKLLGQFIEVHKFDLRLHCSLFSTAFRKIGGWLHSLNIYMEKECGLKKHAECSYLKSQKNQDKHDNTHTHTHTHAHTHTRTNIYIYILSIYILYICIYILHIYIYMLLYIYLYMNIVHMYIYIYIYVYCIDIDR